MAVDQFTALALRSPAAGRRNGFHDITEQRAAQKRLRESEERLRLSRRIQYHMRGNAEASTLRLTLGCLLAEELDIELRRVGHGKRLTLTRRVESGPVRCGRPKERQRLGRIHLVERYITACKTLPEARQ